MTEKTLFQKILWRFKLFWTGRIPEEKPQQTHEVELQMIWPLTRLNDPIHWTVPGGYLLRNYQEGDEAGFYKLMERAGFPGWNDTEFEKYLYKLIPNGLFFVIHQESQAYAATAMALHNPTHLHPFGASLSCVGADPAHQGKGLGYVVSAAATDQILRCGYQDIYLETHDWRLPAIKTYLKMGWVPFLFREDMCARWEKVCQELNWTFTPEEWKKQTQKTGQGLSVPC